MQISADCNKILRCPLNFLGKFNHDDENLLSLILAYHDFRWCKPVRDDSELFAMLALEIMQAGLSWITILKKEKFIRLAFDNFEIEVVSNYNDEKINFLLNNSKIIKNKLKILSVVNNAKLFLQIKNEWGSFSNYIWHFTNNKTIDNRVRTIKNIPIKNEISNLVSFDLKKRGFKFIGSVIVYSYLQSIGVFNDHHINCSFR